MPKSWKKTNKEQGIRSGEFEGSASVLLEAGEIEENEYWVAWFVTLIQPAAYKITLKGLFS